MRVNILGKTGLRVKRLGFGGIPIQRISETEAVKVIRRCYELGINYFDTARAYTTSEERIGKALQDVREEVIIATKSASRTKEGVLSDLQTSLRNLKTHYIDVYQLHNVASEETWKEVTAPNGALEALYKAQEEGKILHLGITSHSASILIKIVKENVFETIMVPYNYLATLPSEDLLPLCRRLNVGTVIMKPLGGGAFSKIRTALKFLLNDQNVDVIIPGMMTFQEIEENFSVANSSKLELSSNELGIIEKDRTELGNEYCRACDYCQPCSQEIPISFILRTETQVLRRMGWPQWADAEFQKAKEKLPSCTKCGTCESRCPYHLPIREMLPAKMDSLTRRLEKRDF